MTIRHPKIRLTISPTIVDSETIFNILQSRYELIYCGIYTHETSLYVYLHHHNRMSPKYITMMLSDIIEITGIDQYKKMEGLMVDETGKKLKHGGHLKPKPKVPKTTKSIQYPVKTPNPEIPHHPKKQKVAPQPPTGLPVPSVKVSNYLTFLDRVYSRTVCGPADPNGFHAVWSSKDGLWYPSMWVGPIRNISPVTRGNIKPNVINELFEEQDSKCRLCSTDVFMGTYSNSDVDHIVPLKHGGNCLKGNLQVLCVTCHRRKTALECKKVIAIMGDDDVTWLDDTVYLTNTHVHFEPGSIPSSSPKDALTASGDRPGLFILDY